MPNVTSLFKQDIVRADRDTIAPNEKELAEYIRDMLRSLGACTRHPNFKALHALIAARGIRSPQFGEIGPGEISIAGGRAGSIATRW